ncbi:type ISP restriction/modification enzyme [Micromonospora sp. LZ34]
MGDRNSAEGSEPIFATYSLGLGTNRDAWVYNYSEQQLSTNVASTIDFYNGEVDRFDEHCKTRGITRPQTSDAETFIDRNPTKISWSSSLIPKVARRKKLVLDPSRVVPSSYRAFCRQNLYFDRDLNHRQGKLPQMFPSPRHENFGFYVNGFHATAEFALLAVNLIPCLDLFGKGGYFFPRYTYGEFDSGDGLFAAADLAVDYQRLDNITDAALLDYRRRYSDPTIVKDDIFYYTYGLLHSPQYRERFAADLKKTLPRIPKVVDFRGFAEAGRKLADLHIRYEQVEPHQGIVETVAGDATSTPLDELYRVGKMKFAKAKGVVDRSTILYNHRVTLSNIPEDAYRYQLGARSAIEWIIDRYQVKTDKDSGIVNDPNDWSDDPRYIVDLLKRIVTVSLETMKIVDGLPSFDILD